MKVHTLYLSTAEDETQHSLIAIIFKTMNEYIEQLRVHGFVLL